MTIPKHPKIYHIMHLDRLQSVISDGYIWCDAHIATRLSTGSSIGMSDIKYRRLNELTLISCPGLYVGQCVPFYFCPRSIMLYVISKKNHPELDYRGGQEPIIHLEADMYASVRWAEKNNQRWAFTSSNAGSNYFQDWSDLAQLKQINWKAVNATDWRDQQIKEGKQAEFLMEKKFPWQLVERIGVYSGEYYSSVNKLIEFLMSDRQKLPLIEVLPNWYY